MNAIGIGGGRSGAAGAEACMIGLDANQKGFPALTLPMEAGKAEPKNDERRTTTADLLEAAADGVDLVGLAVDGCKAVGKALEPSHLTGGREPSDGFVTGGGDGIMNLFQTEADCAPAPEAAADAASIVGDIVSGAADLIGGIIGGIFDGL